MPRTDPHPSELIDRTRRITFSFEGRPYSAFAGDTIASALAAAGVEIFSRSFKYHRPRGLLCAGGKCPNCLMSVNGVPNVRVCIEPVREGDHVEPQHCWPSLRHDAYSLIEKFGFLLPVGFYYKRLYKPRFIWKLAEPVIRRLAGLGGWSRHNLRLERYEDEYLHTDVAVIGGAVAGLAAAEAAAEGGIEVVLIDDQPALDLERAGLRVTVVVDERAQPFDSDAAHELKRLRVMHLVSFTPIAAYGDGRVRSLTVGPKASGDSGVGIRSYACDLVCVCLGRVPALEIFRQNGGKVRYNASLRQLTPEGALPNMQVVGDATGFRDLAIRSLQGRSAGLEAADRIRALEPAAREKLHRLKGELRAAESQYRAEREAQHMPARAMPAKRTKQFAAFARTSRKRT